jgi:hypothetical protein
MSVIPDASGQTLSTFIAETIAPGAIVHTDGWMGYAPFAKQGYDYRPRSQRAAKAAGDTDPAMPRGHRAISNFKSWLRGTHRSVSNEHLQCLSGRVHLPLQPAKHAHGSHPDPARLEQPASADHLSADHRTGSAITSRTHLSKPATH